MMQQHKFIQYNTREIHAVERCDWRDEATAALLGHNAQGARGGTGNFRPPPLKHCPLQDYLGLQ